MIQPTYSPLLPETDTFSQYHFVPQKSLALKYIFAETDGSFLQPGGSW